MENIKIFKNNEFKVLLHIPSSRIFKIDDAVEQITYDLKSFGSNTEEIAKQRGIMLSKLKEVSKEVEDSGILSSEDTDRPYKPENRPNFRSVSLFVAQVCNLKCTYCYGEGGTYGEDNGRFMDYYTAKKSIDLIINLINDTNHEDVGVNFFGGEPLLNFPVIEKTVEYTINQCSKYNLKPHFSITTNGTLLSQKVIRFLSKYRFTCILSIDGPPEIHDKFRTFPDGSGSYYKIRENLPFLLKRRRKKTSARATYIPGEMELWEIINHLNQLEFELIFVEEVCNLPKKNFFDFGRFDNLRKDYQFVLKKFARSLYDGEKWRFSNVESLLKMISERRVKNYFCGGGRKFLAISAKGDIYPCQRFVGKSEWKIGDVKNGLNRKAVIELFLENHVHNKKCKACWAHHFCGGGCPFQNLIFSGNIKEPDPLYCHIFRFTMQEAILLYSSLPKNLRDTFIPKGIKFLQDKSKC